jgi:hypothetical protein
MLYLGEIQLILRENQIKDLRGGRAAPQVCMGGKQRVGP